MNRLSHKLCGTMLVAFVLGISHVAHAQQSGRTILSADLVNSLAGHQDLTYARYGDRELQLNLFRPREMAQPLPAIVCIHGGGWFKGNRKAMTNLAQALAARGYVTVAIDYRLSGEATFPAAIHDCKAAVRWLRANADKYGVDPNAIGVTGLSAGGHLAALLATSGDVAVLEGEGGHAEFSSRVQACVAMGAQSDLMSERIGQLSSQPENPHYRPFLGDSQAKIPEVYTLASPRHHIDKGDPPLMFMTGELDDPSTHAEAARRDLTTLGLPTGLKVIPNAPHPFLGKQEFFDIAVEECDRFFTKHLKEGIPE